MEEMKEILKMLNMEHGCDSVTEEQLQKMKVESYNNSFGNLNDEDGYQCDTCKNKGNIMSLLLKPSQNGLEGGYFTVVSDCKCMKVRKTIRRMKNSGLKDIIKDYTFSKYEASEDWQKTIKEAAVEYAKNPEGWFFIGGQSGAGKTHLCTAICREFLLSGRAVKYMLWRDDIVRLKNAITDPESYNAMIEELKNVEVLYIDDLFKTGKGIDGVKQRPTVADINVAFEVLNYRYNNKNLLTVISSECTISDIIDIDEAVGGRIFEKAKKAFSLKNDIRKNYRLKGVVEL